MRRRSYSKSIAFNRRWFSEVQIDPHYECKHSDISDELILELIGQLNQREIGPERVRGDWSFYSLDPLEYGGKKYRLVWCAKAGERFLGVINCFRR